MTLDVMFAPNISFKRIAEMAAARGLTITKACKPHRRYGFVLYDVHKNAEYLGTFSVRGLDFFFSDGNP